MTDCDEGMGGALKTLRVVWGTFSEEVSMAFQQIFLGLSVTLIPHDFGLTGIHHRYIPDRARVTGFQ